MSNPNPPPGWYRDPGMAHTRRYWDGSQWTGHVAPDVTEDGRSQRDIHGGLELAGLISALLLPIVGFVIGVILLTKKDGWGIAIMIIAIGAAIFWVDYLQGASMPRYTGS